MKLPFLLATLVVTLNTLGQSISSQLTVALSKNNPVKIEVFKVDNTITLQKEKEPNALKSAVYLQLDQKSVADWCANKPETVETVLPLPDGTFLNLAMSRYEILSENAKAGIKSQGETHILPVEESLHYRGIVNNNEKHWVAFSVTQGRVLGMATTDEGNWIIDRMEDKSCYVIYNDNQLVGQFGIECQVHDNQEKEITSEVNISKQQTCPINLFWLGDYNFFVVNNYDYNMSIFHLDAIFNNVAALYQQEGVILSLGFRTVYVGQDSYAYQSVPEAFISFGEDVHQDQNFSGHDLAMMVGVTLTNQSSSGYAVIDALCDADFYYNSFQGYDYAGGRYAYTRNLPFYSQYPTYSELILTVAHEMGHNLGSRHTQWCGWPGGAIDNCWQQEPDPWGNYCPVGPYPVNGGTIMSYCGVSLGPYPLSNGFGPLPNQEIISDINAAQNCICFNSVNISEVGINSMQFKLAPNPTTNYVQFINKFTETALNSGDIEIIDFSGKLVAQTRLNNSLDISHLNAGIYIIKLKLDGTTLYFKLVKE